MSTASDLDLNLENLFQPAWAQGKSDANRFEKFTGNEGVKPERQFSGKPGERRGPRREGGGSGERRGGGGAKFGDRKGGPGRRNERVEERREPPTPLPELNVAFIPEEKGVEQLARQIKVTGRAYPLFQIAQLILQKAERYSVQLSSKKKNDNAAAQQIFVCALDDTPWTSEDEAVAHVLKNHFATFYQSERTATEPPKGVYTFVAQCGMSGVILGPPNYHDYQNQLRKLHSEKFSRMPFETFKSRVKIVKDEAVVKKWIEELSFKTEYTCLNVPEPLKLPSMEEVEAHFRATHKDSIIKPADTFTVAGPPSRSLRCDGLQRLIRQEWEHQRHFPLAIATKLSQQFAHYGLQFFKVNKTVTHVSVARPQYLDIESSPVSDGIKRIVEFINANAKCTRKKLIEALAPTPKPAAKEPAPAATEPTAVPAPVAAEGEAATTAPSAAEPAATTPVPKERETTPEQTAVLVDLHWLIHQGAVLEFADGRMETAKKPAPKPPKPEAKAPAPADATDVAAEAQPSVLAPEAETTPVVTSESAVPAPETEPLAAAPEAPPEPEKPASGEAAPAV